MELEKTQGNQKQAMEAQGKDDLREQGQAIHWICFYKGHETTKEFVLAGSNWAWDMVKGQAMHGVQRLSGILYFFCALEGSLEDYKQK